MTFQTWVKGLIEREFGTATALAEAVGMEVSPFTRGVKSGTLSVVNLLHLARAAHTHPSPLLRMARKSDIADILDAAYGKTDATVHDPLIATAVEALNRLRSEPALLRSTVDLIVSAAAAFAPPPPSESSRESGAGDQTAAHTNRRRAQRR